MDSPTQPTIGPAGPPAEIDVDAGSSLALAEDVAAGADGLEIAAGRGGPPPEVLAQIERAGRIHAELAAAGRELRFAHSLDGCCLIQVVDRDGRLIARLSVAEAIELACGPLA